MPDGKTCFVVMGYHKKTDYQTDPPRTLDLDASYKNLIKPAVTDAGLECIRGDEIQHSGVIDVPMYEQLLAADVVVADLSTANPNALYELGVRHALRPYTTVVIAEDQFKYPFDINHTTIRKYKHHGEGILYDEVMRFREELKTAILEILARPETDSPVYTYLPHLQPPMPDPQKSAPGAAAAPRAPNGGDDENSISSLLSMVQRHMENEEFARAADVLKVLRNQRQNDPYYVQQLAFVTYRSGRPDPVSALRDARGILLDLKPRSSTDPETLGLWGAIHKRLWEHTSETDALDEAILAYERGFHVKNDYYNGINLAFMLNTRAAATEGDEAVADRVSADRVRRRVIAVCENLVEAASEAGQEPDYWVLATLEEAFFALGDTVSMEKWRARAVAAAKQDGMRDSTLEQLGKLEALLA